MNWPNRLTVGRLALTVFFVLALNTTWVYGFTIALVLFLLASITDYYDGELARRYGIVTNFGKLMDPLADKVMIAAGFICLVPLGALPAWVATIVVARDFLITGLRLLASADGVILPAERLGKHKTSWQIATVVFFLLLLSAREIRPPMGQERWWQNAWYFGGNTILWITIGLTIYSGLAYLWRHRALLRA
ncbi:MAG: CDP-diacylglycerol--glycerol-3-phosphate 3-phosphatidyltransferase [Chthoniobacterales bacterium]|nr:CDP-diacylglycerol--glycerol-3-phosphate 3-phosphatidyltransferase [Chthoniobacterales bacterium]